MQEVGEDAPVFLRLEAFDLGFAVADQPQRNGLHTARRTGPRQLAPEDRRQRKAHQIVEGAARQVGVDQRDVDLPRMLHRLGDGGFGNGVEHHPADRLVLERLLVLQHVEHVPGNRFPLPVRVGGKDHFIGFLDRPDDVGDVLLGARADLPRHREILVRPHRAVLGRQVADMPKARQDLIVLA